MANCKVDWKMIPVKALNFLFYAGLACYNPYKPIFQKQLGLSSTQNGLIQAIDKVVGILLQPLSGAIADKTKSIKMVMLIWFVLSVVFVFPMYFIPPVKFHSASSELGCCRNNETVYCHDYNETIVECDLMKGVCTRNQAVLFQKCTFPFQSDGNNLGLHFVSEASLPICRIANGSVFFEVDVQKAKENLTCFTIEKSRGEEYGETFALMFFLTVASSMFLAPAPALIDATACQSLGSNKVKNYGLQRLWGAVGYGLVALTVGLVTDHISKNQGKSLEDVNYLFAFIAASIFFLLTAAICLKLKVASPGAKNILSGVLSLLKNIKIITFLLIVYFSGCALGFQYTFLFWYVVTLPGASQTILGLAILANVVVEIPLYILSGKLAKKTSYNFLLAFGLFCYGLGFMGYSLMNEAWQVLLIETLHGPAFALPTTAMNSQATLLSPTGMIATTVGLTQAIYWGLGYTTGALVGGLAYNKYGPVNAFRGMMVISFVISISYGICVYLIKSMRNSQKESDENKGKDLSDP